MSNAQQQRRDKAAASRALRALAHVVDAGRAGQPPHPKALAVLADVLQALQDGADPGKALGYTRASAGKPPRDKALQEQMIWRMVELRGQRLDLSDAKVAETVYAEFMEAGQIDPESTDPEKRVSFDTFYENWWLAKINVKRQKTDDRVSQKYPDGRVRKITEVRAIAENEARLASYIAAHEAAPSIPDRPDASEEFRETGRGEKQV